MHVLEPAPGNDGSVSGQHAPDSLAPPGGQ
jgi:hypothetical protein